MGSAQKPYHNSQMLPVVAAFVFGVAGLFFAFLYFSLYWPYRDLFNEQGRYFDEQNLVIYHEQNALLAVPALAFLALSLLSGYVWLARRRTIISGASGA